MAAVKLAFGVRLENLADVSPWLPHGPLFHRFLPNGANDAVSLSPVGDPNDIRVWFRRRTKLQGGFLQWDREGTEFDEAIMRRQAKLEGGALGGELVMPDVSEEELVSLRRNPKAIGDPFGQDAGDDPPYVALAKRVIRILCPPVQTFVATLRCQYGQYWLNELQSWDSRRLTLGSYCNSTLSLRWWNEQTSDWRWFLPTNSGATIRPGPRPGRGYEEYLTEADWRRLQAAQWNGSISTELQLVGDATRALDLGEYRQAFIEVISALELAVYARVDSSSAAIKAALHSFHDRATLGAQVAAILLVLGVEEQEIEEVLAAVKVRNKVAHEGYDPTEADAGSIRGVIRTIRKLGDFDEIKCPFLDGGNMLSAP